jgi:hypothetical protein
VVVLLKCAGRKLKPSDIDLTALTDAQLLALIQALHQGKDEPIGIIRLLEAEIARRKRAGEARQ